MRRVSEIIDPCLKERVVEALGSKQGITPDQLPHWYQMSDDEYVELMKELNEAVDVVEIPGQPDYRE
jgi:hypothetical protein